MISSAQRPAAKKQNPRSETEGYGIAPQSLCSDQTTLRFSAEALPLRPVTSSYSTD